MEKEYIYEPSFVVKGCNTCTATCAIKEQDS